MARERARKRKTRAPRAPKTIGELRRLLALRGNPWQPDPRLSDVEPIPKFPTGGDGIVAPVGEIIPKGGVLDAIRSDVPSNPHLRDLWIERGLIGLADKPRARPARGKIRRPSGSG